jgi:hypothetical protein
VKVLACELPSEKEVPVSRFSSSEIAKEAVKRGIVARISGSTVWRWLHTDAINPWQYRSWIFARDPNFEQKAATVLDLYHGVRDGIALGANEYVICADEKTSIQARIRKHPTKPPGQGRPMRVEHEYKRGGAFTYLAAWDARRARLFGHCAPKSGIEPFDRLVARVMSREPYRSAKRVFWIVDNGSSHRGNNSVKRLQRRWPNLVLVHLPVHASWLNQIEIYFSVLQRKVLTPNDSRDLKSLEQRVLNFQHRYQKIAKPFKWRFSRQDLTELMGRLDQPDQLRKSARIQHGNCETDH